MDVDVGRVARVSSSLMSFRVLLLLGGGRHQQGKVNLQLVVQVACMRLIMERWNCKDAI